MTSRNYFRLLAEDRSYFGFDRFLLAPVLKLVSYAYYLATLGRRALFKAHVLPERKFNVPVVSVGNIVWGGSGKTPLVEYLGRFYLDRGKVPLILARGYGEDESKQLASRLPEARLGIGKDRFRTASGILQKDKVDVVILDDGFQHWSIKRDLDIVMINVLNPFGNFSLIPRGILREPLKSLKRASLIMLNDVSLVGRKELEQLKEKIRAVVGKAEFVEAYHEPLHFYRPHSGEHIPVSRLQGERVTAFSGIGTPRSFQMLLNSIGVRTVRNFEFCDHHHFTEGELNEIKMMKEVSKSEEIVTTEKDFVRSEAAIRKIIRPLVLKVRLRLTSGEAALRERLDQVVSNGSVH